MSESFILVSAKDQKFCLSHRADIADNRFGAGFTLYKSLLNPGGEQVETSTKQKMIEELEGLGFTRVSDVNMVRLKVVLCQFENRKSDFTHIDVRTDFWGAIYRASNNLDHDEFRTLSRQLKVNRIADIYTFIDPELRSVTVFN